MAKLSFQGKLLTVLTIGLAHARHIRRGTEISRRAGETNDRAERNLPRRSIRRRKAYLAKINPFVPAALPSPTPQLSKEYIYAGSRLLAVEDANANAAPPADLADLATFYRRVVGDGRQRLATGCRSMGSINATNPFPAITTATGKPTFPSFARPKATGMSSAVRTILCFTYNFGISR